MCVCVCVCVCASACVRACERACEHACVRACLHAWSGVARMLALINTTDHQFAQYLLVKYHVMGSDGSASQALPGQCRTSHKSGTCNFLAEKNSLLNLQKDNECFIVQINVPTIIRKTF